MDQLFEQGEESCLAASLFGGLDADVGGDVAQLEGVSVQDPQGQGLRGTLWQDDEARECAGDFVEQVVASDGVGPRLRLGMEQRIGGWLD